MSKPHAMTYISHPAKLVDDGAIAINDFFLKVEPELTASVGAVGDGPVVE